MTRMFTWVRLDGGTRWHALDGSMEYRYTVCSLPVGSRVTSSQRAANGGPMMGTVLPCGNCMRSTQSGRR